MIDFEVENLGNKNRFLENDFKNDDMHEQILNFAEVKIGRI